MKTSDAGKHCLCILEGIYNKPYKDSEGFWTIGDGHLIRSNNDPEILKILGEANSFNIQDLNLTDDQVVQLLGDDLEKREQEVNSLVKRELNQSQFDAVLSFYYNMGANEFIRGLNGNAGLLSVLNDGSNGNEEIIQSFYDYSTIKGSLSAGRLKRRFVEVAMFISPDMPDSPGDLPAKNLLDGINIIKKYKSMI